MSAASAVRTADFELLESIDERSDAAFYAGVAAGVLLVILCSS
jgi:hypothetical protein